MRDIVFSIGGSVIYPSQGIDIDFLKDFNSFIRMKINEDKKRRIFIIAGGGHASDQYKEAGINIAKDTSNEDLDWLGVRATRLNAHLLRTIFHDIAAPKIIEHYSPLPRLGSDRLFICAAEYPGSTTDWFLTVLAQKLGVSKIFSLLNIKMIFDEDPNKFKEVKPLNRIEWSDYRAMIGDTWERDRQVPFDPFASKLAQQLKLEAVFLDGRDLENFNKALIGKRFIGTTVYSKNYNLE